MCNEVRHIVHPPSKALHRDQGNPASHTRVIEISLSAGKTNKDIEALLGEIATPDDDFAGFRKMLGRMHDALEAD